MVMCLTIMKHNNGDSHSVVCKTDQLITNLAMSELQLTSI
jgi:hypothetical protein